MENYFLKPFIILFILAMSLIAHSKPVLVPFEVKPFPTAQSETDDIKAGLKTLYRGKISDVELEAQLKKAQDFQGLVYDTIG